MRSATLYNTMQNNAPGSAEVPGNITQVICQIFVDSCVVCHYFESSAGAQKQYRHIKSSWLFERMQADCLMIKYVFLITLLLLVC